MTTRQDSPPWPLVTSAIAWFGLGVTEVAAGAISVLSPASDERGAQLAESFGAGYFSSSGHLLAPGLVTAAIGVLTIVLQPSLLGGRKTVAYLLPPLTLAMLVAFTLGGARITALTVLALLVVATVPLVTTRTHRYLHGLRPPSPTPRRSTVS